MKQGTRRRLQFRGHLETGDGTLPPVVSTIEYELYDPTSLSIDLLLLGEESERRAAILYLEHLPYNYLWLHSDELGVPSVEVLGIHGFTYDLTHASIDATGVQVGMTTEPQARETKWHIKAELTPSGILVVPGIRQLSYTGDVSFNPITEGVIEISTSLDTLEIGERYAHYKSEEYGNRVIHTVQRVAITGNICIPKDNDLFSINETLRGEVENVCTILSLCYRQPIDYYEIEYVTDPETTPQAERRKVFLRRRRNSEEKKIHQDELIHQRNLVGGGLDRLLQAYNSSPRKEELSRAIRFLASSYKMATLESSYFLAYSALDLVSSTVKPDSLFLLGTSKWNKIQKLLRKYLNSIAESEGITAVVDQIKEKLPELRRASGDRRIMEACRTLNVETSDLWPKEGFEAGLKLATGMRNDLFHSALLESPDELSEHLVRVRILVERLLLRILEWPDEQIWTWYDQNLRWINHRVSEM